MPEGVGNEADGWLLIIKKTELQAGRSIGRKDTLKGVEIMENIVESRRNRADAIVEKIENVFMTVAGVAIGLSPLLAFV
jgi:hypothetical protein